MHFVFAMQYFSAALRLPIIMQIFSSEAEYRWNLAKCKIWTLNIVFYSSVVIWLSMILLPFNDQQKTRIFDVGILVISILPALILIVSISRLRTLIKQFDSSQFMVKERLMKIHTVLYTCMCFFCLSFVVVDQWSWTLLTNDSS